MIKRFFWFLLCAFFPWVVQLIHDNPGGALVSLVLQATVIGWLPATMWAWRTVKEHQLEEKIEKRKKEESSQ